MFKFVKFMYEHKMLSTAQVWEAVDNKQITEAEAIQICGPRPAK